MPSQGNLRLQRRLHKLTLDNRWVKRYPQTRAGWRDNVALLKAQWLDEDLLVEIIGIEFLNEKIG